MRVLGAATIVAGMAGSALAQPAPDDRQEPVVVQGVHEVSRPAYPGCSVTFLRAPDEVRAVIEKWVAAEPDCSTSIELRVVPTERNTLYLVATRPDGRIHEREVPDAAAAGVLVASWVADDGTAPVAPPEPVTPTAVRIEAPGNAVIASAPRTSTRPEHAITVGGLLGMSGGGGSGYRGDADLIAGRFLSLGLSASTSHAYITPQGQGWFDVTSYRVMPEVSAHVTLLAGLSLRASVAVGAEYQSAHGQNPNPATAHAMPTLTATTWQRAAEVAATVNYDITPRVGIAVGAVLFSTLLEPNILGDNFGGEYVDYQLMGFGGARVRL
jgi:hypothetical protein